MLAVQIQKGKGKENVSSGGELGIANLSGHPRFRIGHGSSILRESAASSLILNWNVCIAVYQHVVSAALAHSNRLCAIEVFCPNEWYLRQSRNHTCSCQRIRHSPTLLLPVRALIHVPIRIDDSFTQVLLLDNDTRTQV